MSMLFKNILLDWLQRYSLSLQPHIYQQLEQGIGGTCTLSVLIFKVIQSWLDQDVDSQGLEERATHPVNNKVLRCIDPQISSK